MKKLKKIVFILVIVMTLTSCGPKNNVSEYSAEASGPDWENSIGISSLKNIKVSKSEVDSSNIRLDLEYENGLEGYKELCDVVNAHNKFVENNPDYFLNDTKITFTNMYASEFSPSFFSNISDGSNGLEYISQLGREDTAKVLYMYMDIVSANTEKQESGDIVIDVPVIILGNDFINLPQESDYSFLSECKSAEQVIIDFHNVEYDKEEISKNIRKYLPNVEILAVEFSSGEDHLEKCP